jgi:hypothetical protein
MRIGRSLTRRLQLAGVQPKEEIHLSGSGLGPQLKRNPLGGNARP